MGVNSLDKNSRSKVRIDNNTKTTAANTSAKQSQVTLKNREKALEEERGGSLPRIPKNRKNLKTIDDDHV